MPEGLGEGEEDWQLVSRSRGTITIREVSFIMIWMVWAREKGPHPALSRRRRERGRKGKVVAC
jgi:hypothetical protein